MRTYQVIDTLEGLRKQYSFYSKFVIAGMLMFFIPFFGSGIAPHLAAGFMFFPFVGVTMMIVVAVKQSGIKKEFDTIYKEVFAKAALEEILGTVDYRWQHGFTEQQVGGFRLAKLGNIFSSEDYLKASYKGVQFEQSDVTIKKVVKRKNGSSTTIYFKGRMIKFDVSLKKVLALQVFTDNFGYRASAGIDMNKIQMEDVAFNKQFDVYSAREHDAFYALTPQFMEKLKEFASRHQSVALHFRGDNLYVAINTNRDTFNAKMNQEINFPQEMALMRSDIQDILDIIDTLGLGNE